MSCAPVRLCGIKKGRSQQLLGWREAPDLCPAMSDFPREKGGGEGGGSVVAGPPMFSSDATLKVPNLV